MTETVLPDVLSEVRGQVGFITLNRPRALNALSLGMVRDLMGILLAWQNDARVLAVAIRGSNKEGPFGAFCAGDAIENRLADGCLPADQQAAVWEALGTQSFASGAAVKDYVASKFVAARALQKSARGQIDQYFSLGSVGEIVAALEAADSDWARATAATLR